MLIARLLVGGGREEVVVVDDDVESFVVEIEVEDFKLVDEEEVRIGVVVVDLEVELGLRLVVVEVGDGVRVVDGLRMGVNVKYSHALVRFAEDKHLQNAAAER